ncbi:hypothetical protein MKX01_018968 [Papaver californicum]|nr:hypothetical protein MKX01_018968 [Papaver californicum]
MIHSFIHIIFPLFTLSTPQHHQISNAKISFSSSSSSMNSIIWFRKGLRIHDNPSLEYARKDSKHLYPIFILDPYYLKPDLSFTKLGSRLLVLNGDPFQVLVRICKEWDVKRLCFEYGHMDYASAAGIKVYSPVSHTLFNPADIIQKNGGKPPLSYQSFLKLAGEPSLPFATTVSSLPLLGNVVYYEMLGIPTTKELGYGDEEFSPFNGGETEALKRLKEVLKDEPWVSNFEKPKTDPSAFLKPATILSLYLKFGCLSSRYFYQCLKDLLWREFFYTAAFGTPNFDLMNGNRICKQIPWNDDDTLLVAWRDAQTGYPWIDAIMVQLRKWGWIHHLARHSVACFLTRGDLYNRVYSPISFGKKYDPKGNYIRHFLPVLKDIPAEYIYAPWTAPLAVQTKPNCIIGRDYPRPGQKMGEAYALNRQSNGLVIIGEHKKNSRKKSEEEQNYKNRKQKLITDWASSS